MAYAAYRENNSVSRIFDTTSRNATAFCVLDVTVACTDAACVRRNVALVDDTGVVRCEPLLHDDGTQESVAPRVRLMIRLPIARYTDLLHRLIECVPSGEIGRLVSWREHLARCGLRDGR